MTVIITNHDTTTTTTNNNNNNNSNDKIQAHRSKNNSTILETVRSRDSAVLRGDLRRRRRREAHEIVGFVRLTLDLIEKY
ncbi:hypothetical protein E2C01_041277 [Portunus trituberculatus]|uniref:Uncharacterized protein n=1 Tax=Portunus trituberculatus TaxID=210409 RepID=A0A5B7FRH7_PORTR|nr:hypothetical protein [Portunus trituberculatus]